MNLLKALNWRYAVKQFSNEKISAEELKELLNAARLSASSYGLQPYRITVVESKTIRGQLLPFSYGQDKIAQSSHLIIFAAHTQIGDATVNRYIDKYAKISNKPRSELSNFLDHMKLALAAKTPEQRQEWAHQQAYIALGNLLTCAAIMKIDSCPMTGIDSAGYDAVLGLNEKGLTTSVICPIGRRHHDDLQANNPKVRFDYDEIVMEV
ncbi:Oxygen-insensitive NAD(P)H nitroreductase / Dihydropteridine reductase [hydrothermal vent metagenome]|uniref:Oxygen-insensitive NAD(P)H nitroreductase / Dihydropteridine reductase n=1 Tax=hydrothermal vent metagenome TaxID=652676 RepID=A0A3B0WBR8_9ZZZZ